MTELMLCILKVPGSIPGNSKSEKERPLSGPGKQLPLIVCNTVLVEML